MIVAIPATSMLKTRLGSNAMRHRWRQSGGGVDLDHARLLAEAVPGCPIAPGVLRDRRASTMTAALSHRSRLRCVLLNVRYVPIATEFRTQRNDTMC
jgi:hypothetical protein